MKNQALLMANAEGDWTPQDNGNPEPGIICAANSSRWASSNSR